jgi:transcription elongation factor GreA
MDPRTIEDVIKEIVTGGGDESSVSLSQCAEVAEALADAGRGDVLFDLATRALPRLVKKERFDEINAIWLACCSAGVFPLEAMLRAADRVAAHGRPEQAADELAMLVGALVDAERHLDAVEVAGAGLKLMASRDILSAAIPALEALHRDAGNLAEVRGRLLDPANEPNAALLLGAQRALRYSPGSYVQWHDYTVAQVVATDGVEARVRHPSGAVEIRRLDGDPPPRLLPTDAHEVRRLYAPDELRASWLREPEKTLLTLLAEHAGTLAAASLKGMLVPRIVPADRYDEMLEKLRAACSTGEPGLPIFDSRRKKFFAPGVEPPAPARKPQRKAAGKKKGDDGPVAPAPTVEDPRPPAAPTEARPAAAPLPLGEGARWVDLTLMPEVRALISRVEGQIAELTRELNVDLPARLEEARAHGDLSENAEYDAAKDRLAYVQGRIEQVRMRLVQLHDLSRVRLVPGRITVMSRVTVADEETGEERTFRITPADLPDARPGDVSAGTPYGKALLGREEGDVAIARLPRRTERLEIVRVVDPDRDS